MGRFLCTLFLLLTICGASNSAFGARRGIFTSSDISRRHLPHVVIPARYSAIDSCAFRDNTSVESIAIPNSVTEIGEGAFDGCSSLGSITIPDSVMEIGRNAFSGGAENRTIYVSGRSVLREQLKREYYTDVAVLLR